MENGAGTLVRMVEGLAAVEMFERYRIRKGTRMSQLFGTKVH